MRHELYLTARGYRALLVASVPLAAAGALVDGPTGLASVAAAVGVIAANHGLAALSTAWARTIGLGVWFVSYGFYAVRMAGVFAALAGLARLPWMHRGLFATAFVAALAASLGAECRSYVRKSYVPAWRMSR